MASGACYLHMWGRVRIWLAVTICLAVFVTFMAHKPACSSGDMLHNKPVPKFKALTADTYVKSGIGAVAGFAVTRPGSVFVSPPMEAPAANDAPTPAALSLRVSSCCLLC
jgi:hypothetical protein